MTILEPGKLVERELSGEGSHTYAIPLTNGQAVDVVVEQKGIDVALTVLDPDGAQVVKWDESSARQGSERIVVVAAKDGEHRLEIRPTNEGVAAARYLARVERLREATERDRLRMAAEKACASGQALLKEGSGDSLKAAVHQFEEALGRWRDAGDRWGEALALTLVGLAHSNLEATEKALEYASQALPIFREVGDRAQEASAHQNIAFLLSYMGEMRKAIEHFEAAIAILAQIDDPSTEAITNINLGYVYSKTGENQKALEVFERALVLSRICGDRKYEARALQAIAVIYGNTAEYRKSADFFAQALPIARAAGNRRGEALILSNLATMSALLGEPLQALAQFEQALSLARTVQHRWLEANILQKLGVVCADLGDPQRALDYARQSLTAARDLKAPNLEADALTTIAALYSRLNQPRRAASFHEMALGLVRTLGDRKGEASILEFLATSLAQQGQPQNALEHFERSLSLRREMNDRAGEASGLRALGTFYRSTGNLEKAREVFARSLSIAREIGSPRREIAALTELGELYRELGDESTAVEHFGQALSVNRDVQDYVYELRALSGMAIAERNRGDLVKARTLADQALGLVESGRVRLTNQELRTSFSAFIRSYYDLSVDLLMRSHAADPGRGYQAQALQVSERSRARGLVDLLGESRARIRNGVDPQLAERESNLRVQLNAKLDVQVRLLTSKHTPEQADALRKEIDDLVAEIERVRGQIRATSPAYAALTQPRPLTLAQIQGLLDHGTTLLEYSLGDERSYLWIVTKTSLTSYTLPPRVEIEAAVSDVRKLLTESGTPGQFEAKAAELGRMVLGPAARSLVGERLAIIADGALYYVPFAALPVPMSAGVDYRPLIERYEIVNLPSATALAELRTQIGERKPAPQAVAVLADPVFARSDSRVRATAAPREPGVEAPAETLLVPTTYERMVESARDAGLLRSGAGFDRLPATRREAERIIALAPKRAARAAFDFDASEATVTSGALRDYRVVHLATHGFLNPDFPELSGIVLSLVDEQGEAQDGYLSVFDVFNLDLPADLVVLSGCETALGNKMHGEGLVGLTRAFMYAGSPRVVASLWAVRDDATAELMTRFYSGFFKRKLRPADALREAQLSMWRDARWRSPRDWAAFVLQGEWK